jgi:uncharacterized membrane protein
VDSADGYAIISLRSDDMRGKKVILYIFSAVLFIVAAFAWLSYVGQGIAYGDLVGVKGREKDIASIGSGAMKALWTAASCEGLAVGLIVWAASDPDNSIWIRLASGFGLAIFIDICTYVLIRGL